MSLPPDQIPLDSTLADEAAMKGFWQANVNADDLLATAFNAGLHADRLAWLFCAAYQAALRSAFTGIPDNEWWALAVSEDSKGELPGVENEQGKLNGYKTWVAASDSVDTVLVSVGNTVYPVGRHWSGVTIETYPRGSFLADMSVGRIKLEDVSARTAFDIGRNFALTEPFYISAAAIGYLLKETTRLKASDHAAEASACLTALQSLNDGHYLADLDGFAAVYNRVSSLGKLVAQLAKETGDKSAEDWSANGKLLSMYRKGIEKRALRER